MQPCHKNYIPKLVHQHLRSLTIFFLENGLALKVLVAFSNAASYLKQRYDDLSSYVIPVLTDSKIIGRGLCLIKICNVSFSTVPRSAVP